MIPLLIPVKAVLLLIAMNALQELQPVQSVRQVRNLKKGNAKSLAVMDSLNLQLIFAHHAIPPAELVMDLQALNVPAVLQVSFFNLQPVVEHVFLLSTLM